MDCNDQQSAYCFDDVFIQHKLGNERSKFLLLCLEQLEYSVKWRELQSSLPRVVCISMGQRGVEGFGLGQETILIVEQNWSY